MSNHGEKEVMGYRGWRAGRRPLLTWDGKKKRAEKKCLTLTLTQFLLQTHLVS